MKYQIQAPVIEITHLKGDYVRLGFANADFARACKPGQFLTVRTNRFNAPLLRRPFGIHDVEESRVFIMFKVVGPGTEQLARFKTGDTIDVLGPLGNGFTLDAAKKNLLVAGGIGVAPLLLTARKLLGNKGYPPELFFGGATENDLPGLSSFKKLGIECHLATEDGSRGHRGFVTAPLAEALEKYPADQTQILACGPPAMLHAVAGIAKQFDVPCQVSLENVMACGVGSCLGCVTEVIDCGSDDIHGTCYQRVCEEGPVFDADDLAWKEGGH